MILGRREACAGDQSSTHTTVEASDDTNADELAQAAGDEVAGGASSCKGKKRERAAGGGQTGGDNESRSEANDATAIAVEQAPLSGIPTATPAQVANKRHKSTASTSNIHPSRGCPYRRES